MLSCLYRPNDAGIRAITKPIMEEVYGNLSYHERTGLPGCLALARWSGWSAGQVGRQVKC